MLATRASLVLAAALAGCAHSQSPLTHAAPSPRLVERLVEREAAISLFNAHQIDQANVFSGYVAPSFAVSRLRCAEQVGVHFDCRFTLATTRGRNVRQEQARRSAWRRPDGGWTTDIIEELCAAQRSALGTAVECQGIVDL